MTNKLIHVASFSGPNGHKVWLLLREQDNHYQWFQEVAGKEQPLEERGSSIQEAIRLGADRFREEGFHPLECGFCFDAESRDEHGINARFDQMVASYSSREANGRYFDESLGHHCTVEGASDEALAFWKRLQQEGRI